MNRDQFTQADPTEQHYSDVFGEQSIAHPGLTADMDIYGERTYRGAGRLTGRRAIVTGGNSGFGRAISIAFAPRRSRRTHRAPARRRARRASNRQVDPRTGRNAVTMPGDIQEQQHCRAIVDRAVTDLGGVDILVNNAAYQMTVEGIASLTTEQMERTYRANVFAMVWLCQETLLHMQPGGSIINTSSIQASQPSPQLYDYATTTAAIVNFTKKLAQEVAARGNKVNSLAPGPIWTPLIPATMTEEKVDSFGQETPIGRAGQPAELAPAFVFLASQESSYITGETIAVTGGRLFN